MKTTYDDPREKRELEDDQSSQEPQNEEGVHLVNDDGTEFDSSELTYVSADLPEEENESADTDDKKNELEEDQSSQALQNEESVYLVNDDGTEFDSSELTYVSADLPEEENESANTDDEKNE